jgi:hypothetical protein
MDQRRLFIRGAAGETDRRIHLILNCGRLGLFGAVCLAAAAPMIGKIPDVINCAANYKLSSSGAAVYFDNEPVVVKVTFENLSDHAAKIIPDEFPFEYDLEIRVSSLCWRSLGGAIPETLLLFREPEERMSRAVSVPSGESYSAQIDVSRFVQAALRREPNVGNVKIAYYGERCDGKHSRGLNLADFAPEFRFTVHHESWVKFERGNPWLHNCQVFAKPIVFTVRPSPVVSPSSVRPRR